MTELAFKPQLPTLARIAPDGEEWLGEIKYDGYRLMAYIDDSRAVRLMTRNGHNWTHRLPHLAGELGSLPGAVLDGELTWMRPDGVSDFHQLHRAVQRRRTKPLVFQVFDALVLDGTDIRRRPLIERKGLLEECLSAHAGGRMGYVRYCDFIQGDVPVMFKHACDLQLEGVVAKCADSPYEGGRVRTWLKVKCTKTGMFVVAGLLHNRAGGIQALLLGERDDNELRYVGRVSVGISASNQQVLRRVERSDTCPFSPPIERPGARWLRPDVDATVEYLEKTESGRLRHAALKALRNRKT